MYTQATQTKDTQTALFTTQSRTDKRAGQAENTKPEAVAATQGADQ
ncbi:MAG: hypothetical protein Q8O99_07780 [bacterium]|nr:hypothetical protein [bacterium]